MYQRKKTISTNFIPKPHFKQNVGSGFQILSDAPEIDPNLSSEMFSLSVNKLNGHNLQAVTIEESNRLCSVAQLDDVAVTLDKSIVDYQKEVQDKKDYEEYLKQTKEKTNDGTQN